MEQQNNPEQLGVVTLDESVIKNAVKAFAETTTEEKIKTAAATCDAIVIGGPGDLVNYEMAKTLQRRLVKTRNEIEQKRVMLKAPGLKYCKDVDAEAKRLQALLLPLEVGLNKKIADVDRSIAQEAADKAEAERVKQAGRAGQLFAAGALFNGTSYVCGTMVLHPHEMAALTDGGFEDYLTAIKTEKERVDASLQQQKTAEGDGLDALRNKQTPPVTQNTALVVKQQETPVNNESAPVVKTEEKPLTSPPPVVITGETQVQLYLDGFADCKAKVIKILESPEKFTRSLLFALVNELNP